MGYILLLSSTAIFYYYFIIRGGNLLFTFIILFLPSFNNKEIHKLKDGNNLIFYYHAFL